jgi:CheY-like chemotaxis protein
MQTQILLIDDDEDEHMLFRWAVERIKPSLKLISAQCAEEAIEKLNETKPAIIFLDITMPRIDGITCLTMIKQTPGCNTIPIYIYSSEVNRLIEDKLIALGASGCIMKKAGRSYLQQGVSIILKREGLDGLEHR